MAVPPDDVLRSLALGCGLLHLAGPPGSGCRQLAERVRGDGDWLIVEDVQERTRDEIAPLLERLAPRERRRPSTRGVRPSRPELAALIGEDAAFCAMLEVAVAAAGATSPVLILGETGAGKDPLAQAVHAMSGRRGPFVAFDATARNESLLDDDLFGHVAGAFADAKAARDGVIRSAHGGTLFLDEIGNLPLHLQAKLLRVIETGKVQPLGTERTYSVDVRWIAATSADLDSKARSGEFKKDLYYRLQGFLLRVPPLRDRAVDVPALARHFAGGAGIAADAMEAILAWDWPGNVRELAQTMAAASRLAGGEIRREHLGAVGRPRRPVVVTSDGDLTKRPGPLAHREVIALQAVTITVPPLREEGPARVREEILARLGDREIDPDVLERLVHRPWWGNVDELDRVVAALLALPGRVDRDRARSLLPDLDEDPGYEPILTLIHPVVLGDDVVGLQGVHREAALAIGRAGALADVRPTDADEPRIRQRWRWLEQHVPGESVAWLPFPYLPELARVHVLVTRGPDGLFVRRAPGTEQDVVAGTVDGGLRDVPDGGAVHVGRAGAIRMVVDGVPRLELFVFLGAEARQEATPALRTRIAPPSATQRPGRAVMVVVGEADVRWLCDFVVGYALGDDKTLFGPALREALADAPLDADVRRYLSSTHEPQALARLVKHPENARLREALSLALAPPDVAARLHRLPAQVRKVVLRFDEM